MPFFAEKKGVSQGRWKIVPGLLAVTTQPRGNHSKPRY